MTATAIENLFFYPNRFKCINLKAKNLSHYYNYFAHYYGKFTFYKVISTTNRMTCGSTLTAQKRGRKLE